jgi:hypothetical protein
MKQNNDTCYNYFKWGGEGNRGRDSGGNLSMFHIRLYRIVTLNPPWKINVCYKAEKNWK